MKDVTAIEDGWFAFDPRLFRAVREQPGKAAELMGLDQVPSEIDVPVWCYLIKLADGFGLVDTGSGSFIGNDQGALMDRLDENGVPPADIKRVWLTHLHGDHCGGLIAPDGTANFVSARVALASREAAFWLDTKVPENLRVIADDAKRALSPYDGRIDLAHPGDLIDGARATPAPGHTAGHMAWEFGALAALAAGDIYHVPALQRVCPDWSTDWDHDGDVAARARVEISNYARNNCLTLLTGHGGAIPPNAL